MDNARLRVDGEVRAIRRAQLKESVGLIEAKRVAMAVMVSIGQQIGIRGDDMGVHSLYYTADVRSFLLR